MGSNTIMILGDSTSMSVGMERKSYPFLLADAHIWPKETRIINCSLPGFTSADAAAFFFRHRPVKKDLGAVIIYLGNCDAASSEIRKGKFGQLQRTKCWLQEVTGKIPVKTSIKNRLLHFDWNNTFDPLIEFSESPRDFQFNLEQIIKSCRKISVPVVLVRPKANRFFPAGVGKGNFVFYRYFGMTERFADRLSIPDFRFKDALRLHESGDFDQAAFGYQQILGKTPSPSLGQEYSLLVVNNYAVARAEEGKYEESVYLFNLLLKERFARKEIILYNLAQIVKRTGSKDDYLEQILDSNEADASLYRIRLPYLEVIDRLALNDDTVKVVDMSALVGDEHYLDHCHLLPKGQGVLADEIRKIMPQSVMGGSETAIIENILYNPELALGNVNDFHDYFKTYSPLSERRIATEIDKIRSLSQGGACFDSTSQAFKSIPTRIMEAFEYYLRHPCFSSVQDVLLSPPRYPSDVGRFPEYFLVRYLIPYLRTHEADKKLAARFDYGQELLRTSEQLCSILPAKTQELAEQFLSALNLAQEERRLPLIIGKVRRLFTQHLQIGNQVFERRKTTIFWYVREALRFGAHSRVSMLYDRILIEYLAEGLAVAGVLDEALGMKKAVEIESLIVLLHETANVHEQFCGEFSQIEDMDPQPLLQAYNLKLRNLAGLVGAA